MATRTTRTVVKLLIWCLIVGILLSFFDISPLNVLASISQTARDIFKAVVDAIAWALPYLIAGAVIVIPVWLVIRLVAILRGRS